nr:MAG TPA: hypothetical protein [Caudoviricetes sp.]
MNFTPNLHQIKRSNKKTLLFKGLNAIWYRVRDFICIVNVSK